MAVSMDTSGYTIDNAVDAVLDVSSISTIYMYLFHRIRIEAQWH